MNIIGKWKYADMCAMSEDDKPYWMPVPEYLEKNPDPMFAMMADEVIEFTADHRMITRIARDKIPPEMAEEVEDLLAESEDDEVVLEDSEWKEEDGKFYLKNEDPGMIGDEEADPWDELAIEDGKINLYAMSLLARID